MHGLIVKAIYKSGFSSWRNWVIIREYLVPIKLRFKGS